MDRLLSMRVFREVVDQGGFAAAARTLDLAPAGVTRLVSDLETHLGARLLQRTTRRMALTDAGIAYLERVRSILLAIDEAESAAHANSVDLRGVLRVAASAVVASYFLAPRLARWIAQYPQLMLELTVHDFPQDHIEDFDLSLLVVHEGFDANVVAQRLTVGEWILCAAPAYLSRAGTPLEPEDLARHAYLRFPWQHAGGVGGRRLRLRRITGSAVPRPGTTHAHDAAGDGAASQSKDPEGQTGQTREVEAPVVLQSSNPDVLYRAALDGAGIAVLSRALVDPQLESGALVRVLPKWIFGRYTLYAAMPTRSLVPARTRAFLEFLREIGPNPAPGGVPSRKG
jgi:DNA-binding transcriptional LysR family regulator